jgi:hypothetical protein
VFARVALTFVLATVVALWAIDQWFNHGHVTLLFQTGLRRLMT